MQTYVFCSAVCYLNTYICTFGYFSHSLCMCGRGCVSGEGVKKCIHGHKVVCVRACVYQQQMICVRVLAELSHGALLFCFDSTIFNGQLRTLFEYHQLHPSLPLYWLCIFGWGSLGSLVCFFLKNCLNLFEIQFSFYAEFELRFSVREEAERGM